MTRTPDDDTMHPRPSTRRGPDRARRLDVLLPDTDTPGGRLRRLRAGRLVDALNISPDRAARFAEATGPELVALVRALDTVEPTPAADPDQACTHPAFTATVSVGRIGEADLDNPNPGMPRVYMAEVVVGCAACGELFKFDGIPYGLSYTAPTVSVDGRELRAPIHPESLRPAYPRATGFTINPSPS
jgi:hypothetical protein